MNAQATLHLVGPMEHLRLVWQTGEILLEAVPFDDDPEGTRYNILLAAQEMLTNILRHGYDLDQNLPIEVTFTAEEDVFAVELRDRGPAFDPLSHDTRGVEEGVDIPDHEGGFGIHIAKHVMDDVVYQRREDWNVLRMTKGVRAPTHAGAPSRFSR